MRMAYAKQHDLYTRMLSFNEQPAKSEKETRPENMFSRNVSSADYMEKKVHRQS